MWAVLSRSQQAALCMFHLLMQTSPKPWQNLNHNGQGVKHHDGKSSNGQDKGTAFHASGLCMTSLWLEKTKTLKQELRSTSSFAWVCVSRPGLLWRPSVEGAESNRAGWFTEVKVSPSVMGRTGNTPMLKSSVTLPLMKPPFPLLRTLPALNCSGWNFPCQVFASGWLFLFQVSTEKGQWFRRTRLSKLFSLCSRNC